MINAVVFYKHQLAYYSRTLFDRILLILGLFDRTLWWSWAVIFLCLFCGKFAKKMPSTQQNGRLNRIISEKQF
jgi:hypothetical protein